MLYLATAGLCVFLYFFYYVWVNYAALLTSAVIAAYEGKKAFTVVGGTTPEEMHSIAWMLFAIFLFMCCIIPEIKACHPTSDAERYNPIARPLFLFGTAFFPGLMFTKFGSVWFGIGYGIFALFFGILIYWSNRNPYAEEQARFYRERLRQSRAYRR